MRKKSYRIVLVQDETWGIFYYIVRKYTNYKFLFFKWENFEPIFDTKNRFAIPDETFDEYYEYVEYKTLEEAETALSDYLRELDIPKSPKVEVKPVVLTEKIVYTLEA